MKKKIIHSVPVSSSSNKNKKLYVTVIYDFIAEGPSELTVNEGQTLLFLYSGSAATGDEHWTKCQNLQTQEQGYIPSSYHTQPTLTTCIEDLSAYNTSSTQLLHSSSSSHWSSGIGMLKRGTATTSNIGGGRSISSRIASSLSSNKSRGTTSPSKLSLAPSSTSAEDAEFKKASHHVSVVAKKLMKRRELVKETFKTEETYVNNLQIFCSIYAKVASTSNSNYTFSDGDYQALFGNVFKILETNTYLYDCLKAEIEKVGAGHEDQCSIGKIFNQTAPFLKIYTEYINGYDKAYETFTRLSKQPFFKQYLQDCKTKLAVQSSNQASPKLNGSLACDFKTLLINPVQRVPRYQMLLQQLVDVTDESLEDHKFCISALQQVSDVAKQLNSNKSIKDSVQTYYRVANTLSRTLGYNTFIQPYRRYVCDVQVGLCEMTKGEGFNWGSEDNDTQLDYHAYLFSDALVLFDSSVSLESSGRSQHQQQNIRRPFLLFLQFCTISNKSLMNSMIKLVCYAHGERKTFLIVAKDKTPDYVEQFNLFKSDLTKSIASTQQNVSKRYQIDNLQTMANSRLLAEENKRSAELGVQNCQLTTVENNKKLHTKCRIISKKEEKLKRLQTELAALYAEREELSSQHRSADNQMKTHESNLAKQISEMYNLDAVLYGCVNEDPGSFELIFNHKPAQLFSALPNPQSRKTDDIYRGKKLRRSNSLVQLSQTHSCDYTAFAQNKIMEEIQKQHEQEMNDGQELKVLFSSLVHYINSNNTMDSSTIFDDLCRLVITNKFILLFNGSSTSIRHKIPIDVLVSISTSTYEDHFICLHTTLPHDFIFSSVKKTEIIEILVKITVMPQTKFTSSNPKLPVNVASCIMYHIEPPANQQIEQIRTLLFERTTDNVEFSFEPAIAELNTHQVWIVKYNPETVDTAFLSNKFLVQKETRDKDWVNLNTPTTTILDSTAFSIDSKNDIYGGGKHRRIDSTNRPFLGDYLSYYKYNDLKNLLAASNIISDKDASNDKIKFCDYVTRYNERLKAISHIMIISDTSIVLVEKSLKTGKVSIPIRDITKISVSSLSDNFICIHTRANNLGHGSDELIYSAKKTEIVSMLRQSYVQLTSQETTEVEQTGVSGGELLPIQVFQSALSYRRQDKNYTGVFVEAEDPAVTDKTLNIGAFDILGPYAFKVSVSKHLMSTGAIFESMEVYIDGIPKPIILCCSDHTLSSQLQQQTVVPYVKFPSQSDRSISAVVHYYAMHDMIGYHIEQDFGQLSSSNSRVVISAIDDSAKSDKKYSIQLKKQQLVQTSKLFERTRRLTTRVLDNVGNEVALFLLDIQF